MPNELTALVGKVAMLHLRRAQRGIPLCDRLRCHGCELEVRPLARTCRPQLGCAHRRVG